MTARLLVAPERLASGPLAVTGDDHDYLFRSRRLAVGDPVLVFDGTGREAKAAVVEVTADRAILDVGTPVARPRAGPHITVFQALIKGERMDWCLEKLVEVGTDRIVPCATERCVVRLDDDRRTHRTDRYQRIAREAARQCGRADVPIVEQPMRLDDALRACTAEVRLLAHPAARDRAIVTHAPAAAESIAILIGPEGGLSTNEIAVATALGWAPVAIGPYVLRAETAGVAAVAILRALSTRTGEPP